MTKKEAFIFNSGLATGWGKGLHNREAITPSAVFRLNFYAETPHNAKLRTDMRHLCRFINLDFSVDKFHLKNDPENQSFGVQPKGRFFTAGLPGTLNRKNRLSCLQFFNCKSRLNYYFVSSMIPVNFNLLIADYVIQ